MLELRRVVSTTWNRGLWRTVFEFVVLLFMVAFIMVSSFLARSAPDAQKRSCSSGLSMPFGADCSEPVRPLMER